MGIPNTRPDLPSDAGFWIGSQAFLEAAQAAHARIREPGYTGMIVFPAVFLYFRAVELALKACLQKHGVPGNEITRQLGHRIAALADRAESLGALAAMGIRRADLTLIDQHAADYSTKWFEYAPSFWYPIPDPDELADFTGSLVEAVRNYLI